jgi:hypothetical protein
MRAQKCVRGLRGNLDDSVPEEIQDLRIAKTSNGDSKYRCCVVIKVVVSFLTKNGVDVVWVYVICFGTSRDKNQQWVGVANPNDGASNRNNRIKDITWESLTGISLATEVVTDDLAMSL